MTRKLKRNETIGEAVDEEEKLVRSRQDSLTREQEMKLYTILRQQEDGWREMVMYDVSFYLAPKTAKERDHMFFAPNQEKTIMTVQYAEFHPVSGHYILPFCEGTFIISQDQMVRM